MKECRDLLKTRRKRTKGKRIKLQEEFVFFTAEVLEIVRAAEEKPKERRARGRPRKRPIEESDEEEEIKEVESSSGESELEVDGCVARRTRSKVGN